VFPDSVLQAIAERRPQTAAELLAISGIGLRTVEKYGALIFRLVAQATQK
jgi:superfamily II DNA helicase RecQ